MTTLIDRDGKPYETADPLEIKRLTAGFGYRLATPFDPREHSISEVQKHLRKHPDDTDRVLGLERQGEARVGLVGPQD